MSVAVLVVAVLAIAMPSVGANPVGSCMRFIYSQEGHLFGPELSMGDDIQLLLGTSAGDTGAVAGVVIDPVACGAGTDPLDTVVTQAGGAGSGTAVPTTPDVPTAPLLA